MENETFISIEVPLYSNAKWLTDLRAALRSAGIKVNWKLQHPHLTLAFMYESPSNSVVREVVSAQVRGQVAPTIQFDKLDVFLAGSGRTYIINLTTTHIPDSFRAMVDGIRSSLKQNGAVMRSDFRFHVTLGEVNDTTINIAQIEKVLQSVTLPAFSLTLTNLQHRYFQGNQISTWCLPLPASQEKPC